MTVKIVHVAVGVVKNTRGEILLSKRAKHLHQGGLWEFPGGKVEQDESVFDALVREFQEEVNIIITQAEPFMTINHDYGDKQVLLDVWTSTHFTGEARSNEDQLITWVAPAELNDYEFPKANQAIIEKLMVNAPR
jgi:8-oxo-dGTP diphosphatase